MPDKATTKSVGARSFVFDTDLWDVVDKRAERIVATILPCFITRQRR